MIYWRFLVSHPFWQTSSNLALKLIMLSLLWQDQTELHCNQCLLNLKEKKVFQPLLLYQHLLFLLIRILVGPGLRRLWMMLLHWVCVLLLYNRYILLLLYTICISVCFKFQEEVSNASFWFELLWLSSCRLKTIFSVCIYKFSNLCSWWFVHNSSNFWMCVF